MKRFIQLSALLLLVAVLAACSAQGGNEVFDETLGAAAVADWDGMEFEILQTSDDIVSPLYYKQDTLLAENALLRVSEVAAAHNCTVKLKYIGVDDVFKTLMQASLVSGEALGDIVFTAPYQIRSFGSAGGLAPLESVSDIIDIYDYKKWGEPNTWEFLMCEGVMYGVVPVTWLNNSPAVFYPIVFNADITRSFGFDDLREFYEDGSWTREKMIEVIVGCTDENRSTPIKGMAACLKHFIRAALLNNGTEFAVFNEDLTSYSCGWTTEAGLEALTWVKDVIVNYNDYMYEFTNTAYGDWLYTTPFINLEAAMLLTRSGTIFDEVAYELDNFGLMPFPVGPYGEYGKWTGFYETANTLSIPLYAKEVECSAVLINEIFAPLEEYPDEASVAAYYIKNVFSDARDYDILTAMSRNCKYSFWPDGGDSVLNNLYSRLETSSPQEILETYGNASDECIFNQMIPSILTINSLVGTDW